MAEKQKLEMIVSPKGIASFPHLDKPDTEGKYADGKYKVTLKFEKAGREDQEQVDKFIAKINAAHAAARGKKKTESPVKDGDDRDNEHDHGYWLITFKSGYQPDLRDSAKQKLPPSIKIRGGDVVRVAFQMAPYEEGKNAGVSMRLQAAMLIEKRSSDGSNAGEVFEAEEDGFVSKPAEEAADASDDDDPDY